MQMNRRFYHIYPLGLTGAPEINDLTAEPVPRIETINRWIDHISDSGFNAVYFGPLFESESHGYDTVDYYRIDRRLGTNGDFSLLCRNLKDRGISIFLDGVFNHVSRKFPPFADLADKGEESVYRNWFKDVSFNPFTYGNWEGHESLAELNLSNRELRDHLLGAVEMWYRDFGIDGLRLDVAYCLDRDFLKELREFTRNLDENFQLLGEVIHGDYREWLHRDLLDSVTNYECYKGIYSSLNDNNYYEIAYSLNRLFGSDGIYKGHRLYNFLDNHDVDRIVSILENPAQYYNALILLYAMPGEPSIYYGSEWQLEGKRDEFSDRALRPSIELMDHPADERERDSLSVLRQLAEIRKRCPALAEGDYSELFIDSNQIAFARRSGGNLTVCALNSSDSEIALEFPVPSNGTYRDLLNNEEVIVTDGAMKIRLWPHWGAILEFMEI